MTALREAIFNPEPARPYFAWFDQFTANVTFQGLVARNTTLYGQSLFIQYDANTKYFDMPTVFTLNDTKFENVSQQGNSSLTQYVGRFFLIFDSSLLRVHRLHFRNVYAISKNTYIYMINAE